MASDIESTGVEFLPANISLPDFTSRMDIPGRF